MVICLCNRDPDIYTVMVVVVGAGVKQEGIAIVLFLCSDFYITVYDSEFMISILLIIQVLLNCITIM